MKSKSDMHKSIPFILKKIGQLIDDPSVFPRQNFDSFVEVVVNLPTLEFSGRVIQHVKQTVGKVALFPVL